MEQQELPCACVPTPSDHPPYDSRKLAKLSSLAQLARKIKRYYYNKMEVDCMLKQNTLYWEPFQENGRL